MKILRKNTINTNRLRNTADQVVRKREILFMFLHKYKHTSSKFRRGMWKKLNKSFNFTWVCRSGKQSFMFLNTSALSCEHIEPPVQESLEIPSLLWSHKEVSLSRTFAILQYWHLSGLPSHDITTSDAAAVLPDEHHYTEDCYLRRSIASNNDYWLRWQTSYGTNSTDYLTYSKIIILVTLLVASSIVYLS